MILKRISAHKRKASILLVVALASVTGCRISNEQTDRPFNSLGRSVHLDLKNEGYVIAIEKKPWNEIGSPLGKYAERYIPLTEISKANKRQNSKFHAVTNDTKGMVVTHIASFFGNREFLYNPYKNFHQPKIDYESGYQGLEDFQKDLVQRLVEAKEKEIPYTHLFIIAMGWNNDQHKAIWRSNQILYHLKTVAEKQGTSYRPLAITLTWPSVWKGISDSWIEKKLMGHAGSYFNKANDADEIGFTIANWILNKQLAEVKSQYGKEDFPFVTAIGHSFGARLIATGLDSPGHLKGAINSDYTKSANLFIGLQGAFSINRFIQDEGVEGSTYENFKDWGTRIILTASNHDSATPIARYTSGASHVGGKFGLSSAKKHPSIFEVVEWTQSPLPSLPADKVTMINCDSIIKGDQAHNDVLDLEMAKLIWGCIQQINK